MPARDLLQRHQGEWREATDHPFLHGIRDGSLPPPAFHRWLAQDYLFVADLLSFQARLLAAAPRRAQRPLTQGLLALEAELTWFEEQAARRGGSLEVARHPTTDSYRRFLEGLLGEAAEPALTALWALERAYLEAWRSAAPGAPEYREFVTHWTVAEFEGYVDSLEALAEDSAACEAAFLETCRLEKSFWDLALS